MYRYSIKSIIIAFIISFNSCYGANSQLKEDRLIMLGLLYDEYNLYKESYKIYGKLYKMTDEKAFLFREVKASMFGLTHVSRSLDKLLKLNKKEKKTIETRRLLIGLYLTLRRNKEAFKEAEELLKISTSVDNLHLCGNAYFFNGLYEKALVLFMKVYRVIPDEDILLKIVDIMTQYTHQKEDAIKLLENHIKSNLTVSNTVHLELLKLSKTTSNSQELSMVYQHYYEETKNEIYLKALIRLYRSDKQLKKAITFLEKNENKSELLLDLYKESKSFLKAINLVEHFYHKTHNSKWIAQKAILIIKYSLQTHHYPINFEGVDIFEKEVSLGNISGEYINSYGYTLIDKEVNVAKGIKFVKTALLEEPHNIYYLDSLAWGYYKEKSCNKALKIMRQVVSEDGLKEPEIVLHWNAIKQCD